MASPIGNTYIERRTSSVPCRCGAKANEPCVNRMDGGRTLSGPHPSRIRRIEGRLSPTERLIVGMRDALIACDAYVRKIEHDSELMKWYLGDATRTVRAALNASGIDLARHCTGCGRFLTSWYPGQICSRCTWKGPNR